MFKCLSFGKLQNFVQLIKERKMICFGILQICSALQVKRDSENLFKLDKQPLSVSIHISNKFCLIGQSYQDRICVKKNEENVNELLKKNVMKVKKKSCGVTSDQHLRHFVCALQLLATFV